MKRRSFLALLGGALLGAISPPAFPQTLEPTPPQPGTPKPELAINWQPIPITILDDWNAAYMCTPSVCGSFCSPCTCNQFFDGATIIVDESLPPGTMRLKNGGIWHLYEYPGIDLCALVGIEPSALGIEPPRTLSLSNPFIKREELERLQKDMVRLCP